jgi:hypothetical protein
MMIAKAHSIKVVMIFCFILFYPFLGGLRPLLVYLVLRTREMRLPASTYAHFVACSCVAKDLDR